jgi:polysaccharide pyruvyl transferase WcaK-like protein
VCPDLAFSLPETLVPHPRLRQRRRRTVGLGLMEYAGRLSVESPSNAVYQSYLAALGLFVKWLLEHDFDVRLLIGDVSDKAVTQEFKAMLKQGAHSYDEERIIDEPIDCVEDLLSQLAMTDLVVATRFHNVLLALFLNKPVLSIAFHHKCVSLMGEMGLSKYSLAINELKAEELIDLFCDLEKNAEETQCVIEQKRAEFRDALEEQYETIFASI